MQTKTIPAKDVEQGQQLTAVAGETLRRRRGVWPTVTDRAYLEDGEGHQPTVYIETHERPGSTWCLDPNDTVTVLQCGERIEPAELLHTVGDFQYWLDRLGLKIPRALCGASLVGEPDEPEPTLPCPACVATDLNEETSMLARVTMAVCFLVVGAILVAPMFWHH